MKGFKYFTFLLLGTFLFLFLKGDVYATTTITLSPDSGEISDSAEGTPIDLNLDLGGFDDVLGLQFFVEFSGEIEYLTYQAGNFNCNLEINPSDNQNSPLDFACVVPTDVSGLDGVNPFLTLYFRSTGVGSASIDISEVEYIIDGKDELNDGFGDQGNYTTTVSTAQPISDEDEKLPDTALSQSASFVIGISLLALSAIFFLTRNLDKKDKIGYTMGDKIS